MVFWLPNKKNFCLEAADKNSTTFYYLDYFIYELVPAYITLGVNKQIKDL